MVMVSLLRTRETFMIVGKFADIWKKAARYDAVAAVAAVAAPGAAVLSAVSLVEGKVG